MQENEERGQRYPAIAEYGPKICLNPCADTL